MSIPISCRDCGAEYRVSDEMAGRTIRCKECDARVDVPDDDEPSPRRRSRKRAAGSNNTTMILLIVGGVLCVACVFCSGAGVVGYLIVNRVGKAVDDINQQMNAGLVAPGNGPIVLSQQGTLMPNDPIREGHPTKLIPVKLQQGKTYVVDLQSQEMDSYLLVFDPANFKVAEDDDSGGFPHARLRLTAQRTGTYNIGCTVFAGVRPGGSRFSLTVREQ